MFLRDGGNSPTNLLCSSNARVSFSLSCPGSERRSGRNLVSGHGVASGLETSPAFETDRETSPVEESDQERNLEGQETDLGVETSLGVENDPEKSLEVEIDPDHVKDVIGMTLGRVYQAILLSHRVLLISQSRLVSRVFLVLSTSRVYN